MFEKESKEYANKWLEHVKDLELHHKEDDKPEYIRILEAHQKGAEFGYNKANEWHYVKDGDLPKDNKEYLVLSYYNYRGKKEISCEVRDNLHSDFEIKRCYTEQIIAWCEIPTFDKE